MYKLTTTNTIIRLSDNAAIPMDKANKDYIEYLVWLDNGNEPLPSDVISLSTLKSEAIDNVNRQAENIRLRYITAGFGQLEVYTAKRKELDLYSISTDGSFPYAEQRANRKNMTIADVMSEWSAIIAQVDYMFLVTEGTREASNDAIKLAESEEEINDILNSISWEE